MGSPPSPAQVVALALPPLLAEAQGPGVLQRRKQHTRPSRGYTRPATREGEGRQESLR
jgi:hypothetical protein